MLNGISFFNGWISKPAISLLIPLFCTWVEMTADTSLHVDSSYFLALKQVVISSYRILCAGLTEKNPLPIFTFRTMPPRGDDEFLGRKLFFLVHRGAGSHSVRSCRDNVPAAGRWLANRPAARAGLKAEHLCLVFTSLASTFPCF
jgi:hypothetical protein